MTKETVSPYVSTEALQYAKRTITAGSSNTSSVEYNTDDSTIIMTDPTTGAIYTYYIDGTNSITYDETIQPRNYHKVDLISEMSHLQISIEEDNPYGFDRGTYLLDQGYCHDITLLKCDTIEIHNNDNKLYVVDSSLKARFNNTDPTDPTYISFSLLKAIQMREKATPTVVNSTESLDLLDKIIESYGDEEIIN